MPLTVKNCEIAYCLLKKSDYMHGDGNMDLGIKLNGQTSVVQFSDFDTPQAKSSTSRGRISQHQDLPSRQQIDSLVDFHEIVKSSPKPVLIVGHFQETFFKLLRKAIQKTDTVGMFYGAIAGFADSFPIIMKKFPNRKGIDQFPLPALPQNLLGENDTGKSDDVGFMVNVMEKVVTGLTEKSELIENSISYTKFITTGLDIKKLADIDAAFRRSTGIDIMHILNTMQQPGLSYYTLKDTFDRKGFGGVEQLLSREQSKGRLLINDNHRSGIQKLRSIEIRTRQYVEEKLFSTKKSRPAYDEERIPLNQDALNQLPVYLESDNQLLVANRSFDENSVHRGPLHQFPNYGELFNPLPVGNRPIYENSVHHDSVNQFPIHLESGDQLPYENHAFDENSVHRGPLQQFPNYGELFNPLPVGNRPIYENSVHHDSVNQFPIYLESGDQLPVENRSFDENSVHRGPLQQFSNYGELFNPLPVGNRPIYENSVDHDSVNQFPIYLESGDQLPVENRSFDENSVHRGPLQQFPNYGELFNPLPVGNRPIYENSVDHDSANQFPIYLESGDHLPVENHSFDENSVHRGPLQQFPNYGELFNPLPVGNRPIYDNSVDHDSVNQFPIYLESGDQLPFENDFFYETSVHHGPVHQFPNSQEFVNPLPGGNGSFFGNFVDQVPHNQVLVNQDQRDRELMEEWNQISNPHDL